MLKVQLQRLLMLLLVCASAEEDHHEYVVEMDWPMQRTYSLEDFLWSGSGDGPSSDVVWITTTVMQTRTIYPSPVFPSTSYMPEISPTPTFSIEPTATLSPNISIFNHTSSTSDPPELLPDQRYWLLTVLKRNGTEELFLLELRLARLYKIAFKRQQELHLGLGNGTAIALLRLRRATSPNSVRVHVLNATQNRPEELDLVYSVAVDGRPVLALAAAHDMELITEKEMVEELGYPVLTKAEPYLGSALALSGKNDSRIGRRRDTWLLVGAAVVGVGILVLLLALMTLALAKRKRRVLAESNRPSHRPGVGILGGGTINQGFITDEEGNKRSPEFLPVTNRGDGQASASSGESPQQMLVRRRPQAPRPKPRKRTSLQTSGSTKKNTQLVQIKTGEVKNDEDVELCGSKNKEDIVDEGPSDLKTVGRSSVISPSSFLSMPSVKSFPRGANIPEPLARVLEPVSVSHLDCEDEDEPIVVPAVPPSGLVKGSVPKVPKSQLTRHASLEAEDPGVIGPVVWERHRSSIGQPAEYQVNVSMGPDMEVNDGIPYVSGQVVSNPGNVSRMRRRFNELLDDAFSLFGSQKSDSINGADGETSTSPTLHLPPSGFRDAPRPHTCEAPRRPATAGVSRPRGAWGSNNELPPTPTFAPKSVLKMIPRPLSAGPFHKPCFPPEMRIYDEPVPPSFEPTIDPAGPLIAAIKKELSQFPKDTDLGHLPGSAKHS